MVQKRLNIFLASSNELSREREIIGNRIRLLNDKWEPKGVRICLEIWEDFEPEFTGVRKQTEYNEKLVDESQIVIGVFRTKCGKYTQEEVLRAHGNEKIDLHCFLLPSMDNTAAVNFLNSNSLDMLEVPDVDVLWDNIKNIIEEGVTKKSKEIDSTVTITNIEKAYATVAPDMQDNIDPLGNAIRQLDMIAEKSLKCRLLLLPMNSKKEIPNSDYYLALFNNEVDQNSIDEFKLAYNGLYQNRKPTYINVFQKDGGTATNYGSGNEISNIMNRTDKEFFSESFFNLESIKLSLLLHIITKHGSINPMYSLNRGEGDNLIFDGNIIIKDVSGVLGLNVMANNDFQYEINLLDLTMPSTMKFGKETSLRSEIYALINKGLLSQSDINRLFDNCSQLISFLKENAKFYKTDYILRAMLLRIIVLETYGSIVNLSPKQYYKEFVDYADRHSYEDLTVERMRIGYANCLSEEGNESEAAVIYGTTRKNLFRLDLKNRMSRTATLCLYYNSLASLSSSYQKDEMTEWLSGLSNIIDDWTKEDNSNYYYKAYVYAFDIDRVEVDAHADKTLLHDAERMWVDMKKEYSSSSSYSFISAFQILTRSLSRYYVDRVSIRGIDQDTQREYVRLALSYLDVEKNINDQIVLYDEDSGMSNLSVMYHNMGFLYTKIGHLSSALKSYDSALMIRRAICNKRRTESNQDNIAETLVNIGALFFVRLRVNYSKDDVETALKYAEESIDIYKKNNDGSLYRETNYYKAQLLKGTVLFYFGLKNEDRKVGLDIIHEIEDWDSQNPNNYYHSVIQNELKQVEETLSNGIVIN